MFRDMYIAPIMFVEALFGCLLIPKIASVNSIYGNGLSGGVLTGLAVSGIIPNIETFYGFVATLSSVFVLFCIQTMIDSRNIRKTISIWSNCFGMSCYGITSGIALRLVDGDAFIKYTFSLMLSILTVSYSLGNRYIEYASNTKDKLPLVMYSLSAPVGMVIGEYSGVTSLSSDILLGASAGTFLMFGINNLISYTKPVSVLYLENSGKKYNSFFVCLSVLCGLVISLILQSSLFTKTMNLIN